MLLEAAALLASRGHLVDVTLAGEGVLRPELERLAERLGIAARVSFLGAVGQDRLRELYEARLDLLPAQLRRGGSGRPDGGDGDGPAGHQHADRRAFPS